MAVATSEASARVGTGLSIIDSSICVATTTGLPRRRQLRMMRFWMPGTRSAGSSTPRSPRATITASDTTTISSSRSTVAGFSSLDMISARLPMISRASSTSSGRCTKLSATQSAPSSSARSRSRRSLAVSAVMGSTTPGTLTPLRSDRRPPTATRVSAKSAPQRSTTRRSLPSSRAARRRAPARQRSRGAAGWRARRCRAWHRGRAGTPRLRPTSPGRRQRWGRMKSDGSESSSRLQRLTAGGRSWRRPGL